VASGTIGPAPSFIEPWVFAPGQTITTAPSGADSGTVTLTMYDVPPDVSRAVAIGGPAVAVTTTQPGQNGEQPYSLDACHSKDRSKVLATATSASSTFNLVETMLPSAGTYAIGIDPGGAAVGTLNIAVTSRQR
jgi:hypothetical protein